MTDADPGSGADVPVAAEPEDQELETEADRRAELRDRYAKVERLRDQGIDPYPRRFDRTHTLVEIRDRWGDLEPGAETGTPVRVAGRVMLVRGHGRLVFATVRDASGEIQLFVSESVCGRDVMARFKAVDVGDWVGATGNVMTTKRGELSVELRDFELLAKALRPMPDKMKGIADVETRYRQRYADLMVNEEARRIFGIRHTVVDALRSLMKERGFVEVETPVLGTIQGGATARPFITHYNALDIDVYLRIALELHLKRLVVGGMERVFEVGRVFRNEGLDSRHNPEFTMLEAYEAFTDYIGMMELTEELIGGATRAARGTTKVNVRGREVDLAPPYARVSMQELISEQLGIDVHPSMGTERLRLILDDLGLSWMHEWGPGKLMNEIYDRKVQSELFEPTFVVDHPREVSPLAKAKPDDPEMVERFELIVDGRELVNAYSELNDPAEQLACFEAEARAKAAGDPEAGDVDYDYVRALEYGMPPTGGLGIGIDRLVMLVAEVETIREVILFPTLRP